MLANILWLALTSPNVISSIAYRAWDHDIMSSAVHYGTVSCKSELIMEYQLLVIRCIQSQVFFQGLLTCFPLYYLLASVCSVLCGKQHGSNYPECTASSKLYRFTVHYRLNWNARVPSENFHLEHSHKSDFQTENWISPTNSKLIIKDGVSARKQ